MKLNDFLSEIGRPVAYYPSIKKIAGSTVAAIFLTQFLYWTGKQKDVDGWIYKTQVDIQIETGLSRKEQETARRQLKSKELLDEKYKGIPRQLFYRVNIKRVNALWDETARKPAPKCPIRRYNNAQMGHSIYNESKNTTQNTSSSSSEKKENDDDEEKNEILKELKKHFPLALFPGNADKKKLDFLLYLVEVKQAQIQNPVRYLRKIEITEKFSSFQKRKITKEKKYIEERAVLNFEDIRKVLYK